MTELADIADVFGTETTAVQSPQPRAAERPIAPGLAPDVLPSEPAEQRALTLRPLRRHRDGIAVLRVVRHVSDDGREQFKVTGDCPELPLDDTVSTSQGRPRLALAELVSGEGERPADIVYRLKSWSQNKTELSRWLNLLRERYGDDLRLIIEDHTDWEIPWELFWLTPAAGSSHPGGWLGGMLPIVRRVTVPVTGDATGPVAAYEPAACSGQVIGFVDDEMSSDRTVLQRYGACQFNNMNDLLDRLDNDEGGLGVVYVGSHGRYAISATEFTLAGVSVFKLEDGPKTAIARSHTLVFMNACHSMREVLDPRNNDIPRSFAKIFLSAGARGVLGTTGLVGLHQARAMAGDLLHRLERPGMSIAVALRDHRAEQARRLSMLSRSQMDTAQGKEILLSFLYSFMYLYVGHPDTSLAVDQVVAGPTVEGAR